MLAYTTEIFAQRLSTPRALRSYIAPHVGEARGDSPLETTTWSNTISGAEGMFDSTTPSPGMPIAKLKDEDLSQKGDDSQCQIAGIKPFTATLPW